MRPFWFGDCTRSATWLLHAVKMVQGPNAVSHRVGIRNRG